MRRRWHYFLALLLLLGGLAGPVMALKSPRPVGPDGRIHMLMYSPDEVFKFTGHYGYQSSIIFEDGEEIQTISMGDSIPWMINPSGNRIFLKPIEQDASTNMTVLTNRRSYLFELHAEEASGISDPNLIFVLRFVYPETFQPVMQIDDVPDPVEEGLENYNFNYTLRGSNEVAPVAVYDDGEFTYFEFRDKNATMPAFYIVNQWGQEEIVNYRTRDDYIIVEQVASRFTLRQGGEVVCVYNEARSFRPNSPPSPRQ
jgi:type IV secretion system protein VirB9